ncbi:MAG: hypothetical protein JW820_12085 [Spirochaetales bacterium]|nr:hypothetical protein [Spirochaetales bacterium]
MGIILSLEGWGAALRHPLQRWRLNRCRRRLRRRWGGFWARVGARGDPAGEFLGLDRRYRERGRHYHNWEHICECLQVLDRANAPADPPGAVELAVWFHDAVYDPRRRDNEERSAALARETAARMGLEEELGRRAAALVLATRIEGPATAEGQATGGGLEASPDRSAAGKDVCLVRDVDLSILGRPVRRYRRYEREIRREYAWVPAGEFRRRRGELLRALLARERVYSTEFFRRRYEARARRNLRWSLRRLGVPEA